LKEQLKFANERLARATLELEEKSLIIQKLEHEKREIQRINESLEVENLKMAEKLKEYLLNETEILDARKGGSNNQTKKMTLLDSECYRTPKVTKNQNKKVLEEDGIRCFDLDRNILLGALEADNMLDVDFRNSIGFNNKCNISAISHRS
jgi:hypothetical protein